MSYGGLKVKKILSLLVVLSLIFSLSVNVFGFTTSFKDENGKSVQISDFLDTQHHWAHDQILKWADYNIVNGSDGRFMPDSPIIRGDLAIIVDRMLGLNKTTYNYFRDLYIEDYYRESVLRCVAEGYINGVGDNKVNPRGNATREEVAVILCRVFKIDTSYSGSTGFKDDSSISSWARSSVYALSRLGYLNGTPDGRVNPKSNITRAEMITLLSNFADTYIPKIDIDKSGKTFVSNFPKNLVVSRDIVLQNSTVGRDIYLTQSVSNLTLTNSKVLGRIVCFEDIKLTLSNSEVSQIYLVNEKSTLYGMSNDVGEVYVSEKATESVLDTFPNKLVLEPGVRVKISGTMYENTTARTKTYYGEDLIFNVADEQGNVVGGPKITNGIVKHYHDNTLEISEIRITEGDSEVREVGIVWLESDKDEEPINPTYKNNDGKQRYTGQHYEPFTIELDDIEGYCTYRLYVKDRDGLYAYGTPFTLEAFDFDIEMSISDEDYPVKLKADVILKGDNVPVVAAVRVTYLEEDAETLDDLKLVYLKKYTKPNDEDPTPENEYIRFNGYLSFRGTYVNGEQVYNTPTDFGYVIDFGDGSLINTYPVLTNVLPEGMNPVSSLVGGYVTFVNGNLVINNSKVVTNSISVDEVGIAYRETSSSSVSEPSNSWTHLSGGRNIGSKETYTFNTTINTVDSELNTFYAPYVKTSNGYYYGEVIKVENNWLGDEGGPVINENVEVKCLGDTSVLLKIPFTYNESLDFNTGSCFVSAVKDGVSQESLLYKTLSDYTTYIDGNNLYICLDNLDVSGVYSLSFRLKDILGLYSNVVNITFDMSNKYDFVLTDKQINGSDIKYVLNLSEKGNYDFMSSSLSTSGTLKMEDMQYGKYIIIEDFGDLSNASITINLKYYISKGTAGYKSFDFIRTIKLY